MVKKYWLVNGSPVRPDCFGHITYSPGSDPCKLTFTCQAGNGEKIVRTYYGAEAFSLRLWLGRCRPDLQKYFTAQEQIAKLKAQQVQQLTLIENSGIDL